MSLPLTGCRYQIILTHGGGRLDASRVRLFAQRVGDAAVNAKALVSVTFGKRRVSIERSLKDLSLISLRIGNERHSGNLEEIYQKEIPSLVGVWSFGDWLLMLNTLVFYFESRRQLVWDQSAQVLRLLFVSSKDSRRLFSLTGDILELDSDIRNTQFI